jgi:hypothetical protein
MAKLFVQAFSDFILDADNYENKGIIGNIEKFSSLSDCMLGKVLREQHTGIFCFLVFHPDIHPLFSKFVTSGTVSIYSVSNTLFFVCLYREIVGVEECAFDGRIRMTKFECEPFEEVKTLFPDSNVKFPGFLFFRDSVENSRSVFVPAPTDERNLEGLGRFSQGLCKAANDSLSKKSGDWSGEFCAKLALQGVEYISTGESGAKERVAKILRKLWNVRGDIGVVVGAG